MQNRGVKVMDAHAVANRLVSEFISLAIGHPATDATAGQVTWTGTVVTVGGADEPAGSTTETKSSRSAS